MTALVTGLLTGWALIVAVGAQNAFLLRQGLAKSHVTVLVAICVLSDLVLIAAAVAGLGAVVQAVPQVVTVIRWAGALFLAGYGVLSLRRALRPQGLNAGVQPAVGSATSAVAKMLALTWLNPHLFMDIVLIGSLANQPFGQPPVPHGSWWFAAGAVLASLSWFVTLGFGSRLLQPLLVKPVAWRILDTVIGVTMLAIAAGLVVGA